MLVLIRGAGDIASGIALRLYRSKMKVVMTDIAQPLSIRRTVCFSQCIYQQEACVEGVTSVLADSVENAMDILEQGKIPVLVDPECESKSVIQPDVLVDAILAKKNLGTTINDAPVVIAVGPGFTAGVDCHAVVETMRGHTLGRTYYKGSALPNTNIPGLIGGYTGERILRAPDTGIFHQLKDIGEEVKTGDVVGMVNNKPMVCTIDGVIRGMLPDNTPVHVGLKSGDVDPRGNRDYCYTASDKALAVGGGVLEAILNLHEGI